MARTPLNLDALLHRATRLGGLALGALVLTAILSFAANQLQENAIERVHLRLRLADDAHAIALERDDLARNYLIGPDPTLLAVDDSLRRASGSKLDSLTVQAAGIAPEAADVRRLETELGEWDSVFVKAALSPAENTALPRFLLGAATHLFKGVERQFADLRVVQGQDVNAALRRDDRLRMIEIALVAIEGVLILMTFGIGRRMLATSGEQLIAARNEVLDRLAMVAEYRNDATGNRGIRIGRYSARTAQALGLDDDFVEGIRRAAPLHDIGMVALPDSLLSPQTKRTGDTAAAVERHTEIGAQILKGASPVMAMAARIARSHHERWDGSGYPDALRGDAIPIEARIVAVVDAFESLRATRSHTTNDLRLMLDALTALRGTQLDPTATDAFVDRNCYE